MNWPRLRCFTILVVAGGICGAAIQRTIDSRWVAIATEDGEMIVLYRFAGGILDIDHACTWRTAAK